MADIITLGELLIDLTQTGSDENGSGVFTAYPGGAPANVAVSAARLGGSTGFIGKVGKDAFGKALAETLVREGVDISGLRMSDKDPTTLAVVSVDSNGEREFSFYRNPGADTQLTEEEAVLAVSASDAVILHIGSLSLTTSPAREACAAAVNKAKEKNMLISYDPNYRASLWKSQELAIERMKSLLPMTDILKVSEEEMQMLTGTDDCEKGSAALAAYGIGLVMVTLGAEGVFVRSGADTATVHGFSVKVADTNGAGDTFLGAMLRQLTGMIREGKKPEWKDLLGFVRYANKAASLTCSRHGAIPAMPHAEEMADF